MYSGYAQHDTTVVPQNTSVASQKVCHTLSSITLASAVHDLPADNRCNNLPCKLPAIEWGIA